MSQQSQSSQSQQINAPFRIKSAGISFFAILITGIYYVVRSLEHMSSEQAIPDGSRGLIIQAVVLMILIHIGLQIALVVGAGGVEAQTARGTTISLKSARNAYYVLMVGAVIAIGALFAEWTAYRIANIVVWAFLAAELVNFGSQVFYHVSQTSDS